VHLQPGLNSLTVSAINKFKKEKVITLSVQANYEVTPLAQPSTAPVNIVPPVENK
jgi:hypothetical protein